MYFYKNYPYRIINNHIASFCIDTYHIVLWLYHLIPNSICIQCFWWCDVTMGCQVPSGGWRDDRGLPACLPLRYGRPSRYTMFTGIRIGSYFLGHLFKEKAIHRDCFVCLSFCWLVCLSVRHKNLLLPITLPILNIFPSNSQIILLWKHRYDDAKLFRWRSHLYFVKSFFLTKYYTREAQLNTHLVFYFNVYI